jgi:hypothetical protein
LEEGETRVLKIKQNKQCKRTNSIKKDAIPDCIRGYNSVIESFMEIS